MTTSVTADELRAFIERIEQLDEERRGVAELRKYVLAEAKGQGYDTTVIRALVTLRRQQPDDIAEFEAIMDMYKSAIGMA